MADNDRKIEVTQSELQNLTQLIVNRTTAGLLSKRGELASGYGLQFDGDRDIYNAAGYLQEPDYEDYLRRFLRQDIAKRVIRAAPDSTWRKVPALFDGTDDNKRNDTDFVNVWNDIVSIAEVPDELIDSKTIWHYLNRVDVLAGLGQYAVLMVGIRDGQDPTEPIERGSVSEGADGLLYLMPYGENDVTIREFDEDPQSPRFGLPTLYAIQDVGNVHWHRVIHVAEDLLTNDVEGRPRAEAMFNRLYDLEKVLPAAAEAAWKLMYKGMIITTKDGYTLSGEGVETDEIEEYIHGLTRVLELEGVDVQFEGGEVVDPSDLVDVLVTFVSIATGIPKRILMGSERGELASSQDEANWSARIGERQENYAEPIIMRPLINRLVYAGVLPQPVTNAYSLEWPSLFELNALEQAEIAKARSETIRNVAPFGDPSIILTTEEARVLAGLPAEMPDLAANSASLAAFERDMALNQRSMQDKVKLMSEEAQELIGDTVRDFRRQRHDRQRRNAETLNTIPDERWEEALVNSMPEEA